MIGIYEIGVINTLTGEERVIKVQENLITNEGLNYFGVDSKTELDTQWDLNSCGVWLSELDDPTEELNKIDLPYRTASSSAEFRTNFFPTTGNFSLDSDKVVSYDDGKEAYVKTTRTYVFPHKAFEGQIYGVCIGLLQRTETTYESVPAGDPKSYPWSSSTGTSSVSDHVFNIFSVTKFKNGSGLPDPVTVQRIEQIFVRYTLKKYYPKYSPLKKFSNVEIDGEYRTITVEPLWWLSNYVQENRFYSTFSRFTCVGQATGISSSAKLITDSDEVKSLSNASIDPNRINVEYLPYIRNTYTQGVKYKIPLLSGNGSIKKIQVGSNFGPLEISFDPPLIKTDEKELEFSVNWSWGRSQDLVIETQDVPFVNPSLETDTSSWELSSEEDITRNDVDGKQCFYLTKRNISGTISQTVDLSTPTLENKILSLQYRLKTKNGYLRKITIEYLDGSSGQLSLEEYEVNQTSNDINNKMFYSIKPPEEAYLAEKMKVTYEISTNTYEGRFVAITDFNSVLITRTPISE